MITVRFATMMAQPTFPEYVIPSVQVFQEFTVVPEPVDRIRGVRSNMVVFDEVQDLDPDTLRDVQLGFFADVARRDGTVRTPGDELPVDERGYRLPLPRERSGLHRVERGRSEPGIDEAAE